MPCPGLDGTAGPWDCLSAAGNPAESDAVSGFLKAADEEQARQGASLKEIMLQGFWKKPETARHYIGMLEGLTGESMSSAIATKVGAEFLITAEEASLKAQPIDFLVRTAGR